MIPKNMHEHEEEQHPPNPDHDSVPLAEVNHASSVDNPVPLPISPPPSSSTDENDDRNEIIRSPLDQRLYKSITLPNGLRAMLISTFKVRSFPEEQDATKAACQIPEVAEFNKMYLGYDNPAARVKCACPCDEKKACCCGPAAKETATANGEEGCKNTLKDIGSIKAACCSKNNADSDGVKRPMPEENVAKKSPKENAGKKKKDKMEKYLVKISNELKKRELAVTQAKRIKSLKSVRNKIPSQINDNLDEMTLENSVSTHEIDEIKSQESFHSRDTQHLHNSAIRNYPHPPKSYEGLQTNRTCPIETSHKQKRRASRDITELDATVYLVIGSGYFDDPDDQPGLAHFCEHAVFLGSNKFPEPNQLFNLVLPYNGYVNAYTSGMMTTFTVSSSYKLFPLAVEILGDMVGFPLFPNTLVAAELEALDSEYSLRQDDTPKYFQLIGSLAKKGHVMRKMDSGNISTLTVPNFYRKLVEWRKIYYNPSRMTVSVEAPFPLDFLESLVTESFGKIPHPHVPPIPLMVNRHLLSNGPFDMKRFHQIYHVPSVYHSEFIAIHWALDAKAWKNLKVKPLEYLGGIVSHKADGGLFHYLTTQGLATNVDAGCWESDVTRNHYTAVFSISVDMTDKGFKRQDNILQAIFGYIEMLKVNKPQRTFFQELQKQQLDAFHYKAAEIAANTADGISHWMQFIPPQWSLISPALTSDFDDALIQKYTESLTIDTANVIIFSKNYRGVQYTSQSLEEFYNTPYAAYYFPNELKEKIKKTKDDYARNFTLPPANPLLLNTVCSRAREKDLLKKGTLARIKGKLSVVFVSRTVKLVRGLLTQARYSIWVGSPVSSYHGAPEGSSTKMLIWSLFLGELFESKFYHASTADIQLDATVTQGEMHITLAGPNTMLPPLVEQVFNLFSNFENKVDQVQFEVIRSSFIETLDNTILDNRFLAWDLFYYLWTNNHDLIFDHKRNAEHMTFANFISFVKSFKSKMYIQAHLYGYVTKAHGQAVINALSKLEYSPIEDRQYLLYRCLRLPLGERIIKVNSQNPNVHTSVVINCYQFGVLSDDEEEAVNFFAKTMSDAAFYQLRTEQQLGYIIIIYAEITYGVSSIVVELVTQPKNFSTDYCNECIDKFLFNFFMENLSTSECFLEFSLGKPRLDIPFHGLKNLFETHLLPNHNGYRKLSIQVVGDIQETQNPTKNSEKPAQVQHTFQKTQHYNETEPDHMRTPEAHDIAGHTNIEHVRAAKKVLQMMMHEKEKKKQRSAVEEEIPTKVVKDVAKFKRKNSLIFHPDEIDEEIQ